MNQEAEHQALDQSSRKRRIAAIAIDHIVMTLLMVSIMFVALSSNFLDENTMAKMPAKMLAVMLPVLFVYLARDSIKGISAGRWIMGIMVRDANTPEQIPSFGRLLVRNLFLIIWPVELFVLASSREKKRMGDKTAKTIVVQNPNKPTKPPRVLALIVVGVAFFAVTNVFPRGTLKSSEAYKVAVMKIEQNQAIVKETGGIKGYGAMPTGSVNLSNGNGQADLYITVLGNEKDLKVSVYLTKEPNSEWELIEMYPYSE